MNLEAQLRFLLFSVLWVTLVLSVDGVLLKDERYTTGKQKTDSLLDNPSIALLKLLRVWELSKHQPESVSKDTYMFCQLHPVCSEGFSLYKTNKQNSEGCFQYQCIHPMPKDRGYILNTTATKSNTTCAPAYCPKGYEAQVNAFRSPTDGCPMYVCKALSSTVRPQTWNKCIMSGSVIDTVEGHALNCFDACNVTMLRNKCGTINIKVLKLCNERMCNKSLMIHVKHKDFNGSRYIATLKSDLYIDINDGFKIWRYSPQRAFLISKIFPFKVGYSGDTLIFAVPAWKLRVIWDSNMDARIQYIANVTGKLVGACSIAGGMGPNSKTPGYPAATNAEHLSSWKSSLCHNLKCTKQNEIKAWKICDLVREEPFSRCKSVMDTCNYPARCKDTVCSCLESGLGEAKCTCNALSKFTKECLLLKPDLMSLLQDGLNAKQCVPTCPLGKTFHYCYKKACQKKCETIETEPCSEKENICISGCRCPKNMVDKAGRCVLRSKCRNCVCAGSNDGTLKTFDDMHFKYRVGCTQVASRDENNNMQLYMKTTLCADNKNITCGIALTVKAMSGYVFVVKMSTDFLGQTVVTRNSKRIKLPYKDHVVSIVPIVNGAQILVKEIQLLVTVTSDPIEKDLFHYKLRVPSELYGKQVNPVEGICGVCGGTGGSDKQPRLKSRDNGLTNDIFSYVQSWLGARVSTEFSNEEKEIGCKGEVISKCKVIDRKDEHICKKIFDLKETVFDHCIKDPEPYFQECKGLICTKENMFEKKTLACQVWQEYASDCCEETHHMEDWRKLAGCPAVVCDSQKNYSACGPGCDATCLQPKCSDSIEWKEGCYCPPGLVQGSTGCIRPSQCNICLGHLVGETWKDFQSCEKCKCDACKKILCKKMCPGPLPKCSWDQTLKGTKESGGCCSKCECTKPCPPPKKERECIKGEILRTTLTDCGCELQYCYCEPLLCKPKPTCNGFQSLSSYKLADDCCEYHKCECIGASSCPTLLQPKCTDEQVLENKYDEGKCCVTGYECNCLDCPIRTKKPVCRYDQKLVKMTTPCGCIKYECQCEQCPPEPVCGNYAKLEKYTRRNSCCPIYYCNCRHEKCPSVQPDFDKCTDDEIIASVFDRSRCCIIRYVCKCPNNCRTPRKPVCDASKKLVGEKSFCNCKRYKCVCDMSKCEPVPKCGKYQVLKDITQTTVPKPCCKIYKCECVDLSKCPKIPNPRCEGEKTLTDVFDHTGCCVVKKKCVCPDVCDIKPYPTCGENEMMVTNITDCNCKYRSCVCDKEKCPVVRCGKYEELKIVKTNDCCDKKFCQCNYTKCGNIKADATMCTDEEKLFPLFDQAKCCVIGYKCECQPCKTQKGKQCGPLQKLITKRSKCNCPHFSCECDPSKCRAPPTCGKYSALVSHFKDSSDCCKTHECICDPRRCPQLDPRDTVCVVGKVQKAIIDDTKCCVTGYKCECLPCVRPSPKFCQPGERLKVKKDDCGCYHPVCLCNGTTKCSKKPKCSEYQYLRTTSNTKDCCMIYSCVCKGLSHCPPLKVFESCGQDQVMKEIYDPDDCCIISRICVCDKCKPSRQLVCGRYERTVNKPSKCCNHYSCECDSSKCPVKQCPPYHKLNVYYVKDKCCPMQKCECLVDSCPDPSLTKPTCKDEEEYAVVYDTAGCCSRHVCRCPQNACSALKVVCGPFEKLVSKKTACGCTISHCECDVNKCKYPAACSKYQKMVKTEAPDECCPKFFCVCEPKRCPEIEPSPEKCTEEEWLKPVSDPDNCCIVSYTCVCNACPKAIIPQCKSFEKVKVTKSKCGCDKPSCVCDESVLCEPTPVCSIYQQLIESDRSDICCKRYDCICRGTSFCPKLITPNCKDEERALDLIDEGNCCIIKKKCKCPAKCPTYPKPRCKEGERIIKTKTKCCTKSKCICDKSLCPPITCGKYQERTAIPVKGKCCDDIQCHCAPEKCPTKILKPKCKGDQILGSNKDPTGCCVVSYECKCETCSLYQPKICRRDQRVVMGKTTCGCLYPKCKCDYTKCPKKKTCGKYERLEVRKQKSSCCSTYKCVCNRKLCQRTKPNSNMCKDEQILLPVYDEKYCCVIDWKCECQPCPKYSSKDPICNKDEVIVQVKSACGCPIPICMCSNLKCPPRPKCDKNEKLVQSGNDTDCCVGYKCVCISLDECPLVWTPKCEDEEVVMEHRGKCCIEKKTCVCPKTCPEKSKKVVCKDYHRLVKKPTKCCWKYVCECDKSQCPVLRCPSAHVLFKNNIIGQCCPKQECVCKPDLCPKISPQQIICKGDQRLTPVKDDSDCCISYTCRCDKCRIPEKLVCGETERVVEKRTICGCRKYECSCDLSKCRKSPNCGKFAKLKTVVEVDECCPTYTCECKYSIENWKDCQPGAEKPTCKDEQALTPSYDNEACCIRNWLCVCGKCPIRKRAVCDKDQKEIIQKTVCSCDKPLCVCADNAKCNVKPECSKYQNLIILPTSTECCKRYECVCKGISQCPIINTPVCEDEENMVDITDVDDCCVVKKVCVCPDECPNLPTPKCSAYERAVSESTKCCERYRCECDISKCPRKVCRTCMVLQPSNHIQGECCPTDICVCNSKCCPRVPMVVCRDEQTPVAVFDADKCCIIKYECKCGDCKDEPRPDCGSFEKEITKTSICNCKSYTCECDARTCPDPQTCSEFQVLDVINVKGECCPKYKCTCNKMLCPKIRRTACKEDEILHPVVDPSKCCIRAYTCVCSKCKFRETPACNQNEIVVKKKTACGCETYECKCNENACDPIPECNKYQVLRTYNSSTCCQIHVCECKGLQHCPKLRPLKCHEEEELVLESDTEGCCVINSTCVCPRTCPVPREPKCKYTERVVSVPTKCCNKLICICDTVRCSSPLRCGKFEELRQIDQLGKCCPNYLCKPPAGCVVEDRYTGESHLKMENETWTEKTCLICKCRKFSSSYEINCQYKTCPICKSGYKYKQIPGECCGTCEQTHCIQRINGRKLINVGGRWRDKCNLYECTKRNRMIMIEVTRAECNPVPFCNENEVQQEDECKCPTCKYEVCDTPVLINPSLTVGLVKIDQGTGFVCQNIEEIQGLTQCVGNCKPGPRSSTGKTLEAKPSYCRNKETKTITVPLVCPDGKRWLQNVKIPTSCECRRICDCEGTK